MNTGGAASPSGSDAPGLLRNLAAGASPAGDAASTDNLNTLTRALADTERAVYDALDLSLGATHSSELNEKRIRHSLALSRVAVHYMVATLGLQARAVAAAEATAAASAPAGGRSRKRKAAADAAAEEDDGKSANLTAIFLPLLVRC